MPTSPPALQRAATLVPLPELLADLDVPLDLVLEGTGIQREHLTFEAFVPYAAIEAVLERAARISGVDDLGLRLGLRQTLRAIGPIGHVMRHSATLGEALHEYVRMQIGNSRGAATYLHKTNGEVAFGYCTYRNPGSPSPQVQDLAIASGVRIIAEITHNQVRPEEVHIIRPQPASVLPYAGMGGVPVRFGQSQTCMFLSAAAMATPLPDADITRKDEALARVHHALATSPLGLGERVRHVIGPMLSTGASGVPDIAGALGMHARTLQRQLHREGTSVEALRDDVRFAVAQSLLALTPLSVLEIALALGYATQSAFIHAFRRWSGTSPTLWRSANGPTGAAPNARPRRGAQV